MLNSQQVILCIQQNYYSSQFDVNKLSVILNISPSYLREIVKVSTGVSPQKLIELCRICHAIFLFKESCCIDLVCQKVGYTYVRSFYRTFKRITGLTPQVFILQHCPQFGDEHIYHEFILTLCKKHGLRIHLMDKSIGDFVGEIVN
ncbi:MAG: helix-turn-helix domain-containing protein [Bacteriodetes bacterium]|nr:helix-turn-helix domain-containing protein [Bacteroidota bacterium]